MTFLSKPKSPSLPPPPPPPAFTPTRADASVSDAGASTTPLATSFISSGSTRGSLTRARTGRRSLIGGDRS